MSGLIKFLKYWIGAVNKIFKIICFLLKKKGEEWIHLGASDLISSSIFKAWPGTQACEIQLCQEPFENGIQDVLSEVAASFQASKHKPNLP